MSALISDEYRAQLRKMREIKPNWGNAGQRHADAVSALMVEMAACSVLDYGCGHGMLMQALQARWPDADIRGYDPGMEQYSAEPAPADVLVSTDVLEHIEPDKLDGVLTHMRFLAGKAAYVNIHTGPARAVLPDGRNAHLIQKPAAWWKTHLSKYFSRVERVEGFSDARPSFVCA